MEESSSEGGQSRHHSYTHIDLERERDTEIETETKTETGAEAETETETETKTKTEIDRQTDNNAPFRQGGRVDMKITHTHIQTHTRPRRH